MSDLLLSIEWKSTGCGCCGTKISGVVIDCCDLGDGWFETTVLFLPGEEVCAAAAFRHLPN
ncbi:MAG: hypothetical protein ABIP20_17035 [Chthoniobacteraceae bacterium]